jgi:cytochrome c553
MTNNVRHAAVLRIERIKALIMKFTKSTLAVLAIVTTFVAAGGAQATGRGHDSGAQAATEEACPLDPRAWDGGTPRPRIAARSSRWDNDDVFEHAEHNPGAAAAARNCTWCHGNTVQGYAIAPRLAGQHRAYIESQLLRFRDKSRNNPYSQRYMWHAAGKVDPQVVAELAEYFASIPPEPANNGDEALAPKGRVIYDTGLPSANIVACILPWPECAGHRQDSAYRRSVISLPQTAARAVDAGLFTQFGTHAGRGRATVA